MNPKKQHHFLARSTMFSFRSKQKRYLKINLLLMIAKQGSEEHRIISRSNGCRERGRDSLREKEKKKKPRSSFFLSLFFSSCPSSFFSKKNNKKNSRQARRASAAAATAGAGALLLRVGGRRPKDAARRGLQAPRDVARQGLPRGDGRVHIVPGRSGPALGALSGPQGGRAGPGTG